MSFTEILGTGQALWVLCLAGCKGVGFTLGMNQTSVTVGKVDALSHSQMDKQKENGLPEATH